jgi:hypothetical protein
LIAERKPKTAHHRGTETQSNFKKGGVILWARRVSPGILRTQRLGRTQRGKTATESGDAPIDKLDVKLGSVHGGNLRVPEDLVERVKGSLQG